MEFSFAILLFAFSVMITLGPNNVMIMASGVNFGIKRSVAHLLGACLGSLPMILVLGVGFKHILSMNPIIHEIIQALGILYLLYLAWLIAHSSLNSLDKTIAKPITFIKAALFQWLNPKTWISSITLYTSADFNLLIQILYISIVFVLIKLPCLFVWLLFGTKLKRYLKNAKYLKIFNFFMASLLVISVSPILST